MSLSKESSIYDVDLDMLRELSEADGISGCEKEVSRVMKKYLEKYSDEISYDNLGSIIGLKKGKEDGPKIMIQKFSKPDALFSTTNTLYPHRSEDL